MAAERVLVIGGGRGIGLAVAEAWAAGGHDVTVVARRRPEPAGLRFIEADLESPASTAAMLDAYTASAGAPRAVVFAQRARAQRTEWTSEMRVSVEATRQIIEGVAGPMQAEGIKTIGSTPAQLRQLMVAEVDRWKKVVQDGNIKLEE